MKKSQFTPLQKQEISDIIDANLPKHLANFANADVKTIVCAYKADVLNTPLSNCKETEILVYKNEILKIFCTYNEKSNFCSHKENKSKTCYLHL